MPVWQSRQGRKSGFGSAGWSRWPTALPWCRLSTFLCRRRWTRWNDVEQVIEVPKILQDSMPQRALQQLVEQLVWWKCLSPSRSSWHTAGTQRASVGARSLRGQGGLLLDGGNQLHQVGPPRRDSPPAQGDIQILGTAAVPKIQKQIVDKAVDVLVTMLHKFQQSVPQIQSIDRVLDIPVMPQRQYAQCQTVQKTGESTGAVRPSLCNDRCGWSRQCSQRWSTLL